MVIIKNNVLGQIKWEQMVFLGNPEYRRRAPSDRLRQVRRGLRRRWLPLRVAAEVRAPSGAAFASNKPAIVEAVVDPFEPPMPAQATVKQGVTLPSAWFGATQWRQDRHHDFP